MAEIPLSDPRERAAYNLLVARGYICLKAATYEAGKRGTIRAFVARVDARAERDILAGRPITGAHNRAIRAELAALTKAPPPAGEGEGG